MLKEKYCGNNLIAARGFGNRFQGFWWLNIGIKWSWMAEFKPQGEKPKTVCTKMNISTVVTTIEEDCQQSVWALAIELKISQKFICQILISKIGTKPVSLAWVLHFLRMDEIQTHFHTCTGNLVMITNELEFLIRVITADESWIHHYDPLLKNESSVWLHYRDVKNR